MKAKISVFVICVEAIIYLLLYNLHDCTFNSKTSKRNRFEQSNNLFSNNPNERFSYCITTSNRFGILKSYEKNIEGNTDDSLTNNEYVTQNSTVDSIKRPSRRPSLVTDQNP